MTLTTPAARAADIVVQSLENEVLLYDLRANRAFCLNETCAFVYQRCDGKTTFADVRRQSGGRLSDDVIRPAIDELSRQNLLAAKPQFGISRRSLLRKAAASAVALPIITALVAPTAAQAQSVAVCVGEGGLPNGTFLGASQVFCSDLAANCCTGFAAAQECGIVGERFTICSCYCADFPPDV